jgi:hypothetical protein
MSADKKELQEKMDEAAKAFAVEFRALVNSLNLDEANAIAQLIDLTHKYRDSAGYKRMFHHMFKERGTIKT